MQFHSDSKAILLKFDIKIFNDSSLMMLVNRAHYYCFHSDHNIYMQLLKPSELH